MSLLGTLRNWATGHAAQPWASDTDRHTRYNRHLRAYHGYAIRGTTGSATITSQRRLRFNLNRSIVNLGAQFFAAAPVNWQVDGDRDAEAAAADIWVRSGSDRAMLEAARCGGIYGDVVAIATQDEAARGRIEFVEPGIAYPFFSGNDYSKLEALEIVFRYEPFNGWDEGAPREIEHRERYTAAGVRVEETGKAPLFTPTDGIPAAWIRNTCVLGQPFGISDLEDVTALVEEYDHVASKQTRIIDYYSKPNLAWIGVRKGSQETIDMGVGTVFFVPEGGDMKFVEWAGPQPGIEEHLGRIRDAISEISQVPAIAFGDADRTGAQISGVALRVLYGPLLAKTRDKQANWGPALEHLMALCLRAEGHEIEADRVHAHWQDPLPQNLEEMVNAEVAKVTNNLSSRRAAMERLGTENPNREMRSILVEGQLAELAKPPTGAPAPPPRGNVLEGAVPAPEPPSRSELMEESMALAEEAIPALLERLEALFAAEEEAEREEEEGRG